MECPSASAVQRSGNYTHDENLVSDAESHSAAIGSVACNPPFCTKDPIDLGKALKIN
jgi:hypothetical protein